MIFSNPKILQKLIRINKQAFLLICTPCDQPSFAIKMQLGAVGFFSPAWQQQQHEHQQQQPQQALHFVTYFPRNPGACARVPLHVFGYSIPHVTEFSLRETQ